MPVVRDADRMRFAEIEKAIGDFGERARDGKLTLEELTGGTFTITNGGVFGSLMSTPILNPPQSGILGMHKIQERPVVDRRPDRGPPDDVSRADSTIIASSTAAKPCSSSCHQGSARRSGAPAAQGLITESDSMTT